MAVVTRINSIIGTFSILIRLLLPFTSNRPEPTAKGNICGLSTTDSWIDTLLLPLKDKIDLGGFERGAQRIQTNNTWHFI